MSAGATFRCSTAARDRADVLAATAAPARAFLLLETNGPWASPDVLVSSGIRHDAAEAVRHRAGAAGARVLLIRRPGRHPAPEPGSPRRWAVARLGQELPGGGAGPGRVVWGTWTDDDELAALDPAAAAATVRDEHVDPPLLLVCCHGRHDVCCAIEGRPVANELHRLAQGDPARADVWECSHVGGDRFAANVLALPSGLLSGGLTAATAGPLLEALVDGRVLVDHFRGRFGDAHGAQAAQWHAMHALGEDRPGAVLVESVQLTVTGDGDETHVLAQVGHAGRRYRIELVTGWSQRHRLTCRGTPGGRSRTYRLIGLTPADAAC